MRQHDEIIFQTECMSWYKADEQANKVAHSS
jgi:hypothetical protein